MFFTDNISKDIDAVRVSESMICSPESLVNIIDPSRTSLSIMHTNIRSVACNFDQFVILLERVCIQCDVLVLTECWLSKMPTPPLIPGYTSYSPDYTSQNDGVIIYIKSEIRHSVMKPLFLDANCLVLQHDDDYAVVAIYRSPSCRNIGGFSDSLDACLTSLKTVKSVVLIGDININIAQDSSDPNCSYYLDQLAFHGLLPAHTFPTRNASCLDHVILRSNRFSATYVLDSYITDHAPLVFCLNCKVKRNIPKTSFLKIDYPSLCQKLAVTDFNSVYLSTDANVAATNFINKITEATVFYSKPVTIPHHKRTIKPWLTPGLVRCIRHRDRLHMAVNHDKDNAIMKVTYTRYRNFCNNLLKKLKTEYEKAEFRKNKNNPKGMWNTINKIANIKQKSPPPNELLSLSHDPQASVNSVNHYFAGIGKTLANAILRKHDEHSCNKPHVSGQHLSPRDSMVLFETDPLEIDSIITNLKNDSATGIDNIPTLLIKNAKSSLVGPITHICNLCLATGVFPDILKNALVHPIHKAGNRDSVGNYRPISVLTAISKILEKLINRRLVNYIKHNNILSANQFGFIKGKSTDDATLLLTETIAKNLDAKKKVIGVFLDMSKAFDTVSVPILLTKMASIGIRGIALDIFRSYLTNRTQWVRIGNYTSEPVTLSFGVPQGSVLGPSLFLLYINSLCEKSLLNCDIITYADDTALIVHGEDWDEAKHYTEIALKEIITWLDDNLLTLNVDKTKFVTFAIRTNTQPPADFVVGAHSCRSQDNCSCQNLSRTTSIKYLGLMIDSSLNWSAHIGQLTARTRKLIPIFWKLRNSADHETLLCVYYALAQSLLQYCIVVWGGIGKTALLPLERTQRAILKVMLGRPRRYSTVSLYTECPVLSVRRLFVLLTILRKHKNLFFTPILKRNKTRVCSVTPHRTKLARRQFYVISSIIYNTANRVNNVYALAINKCKIVIRSWLQQLDYTETDKVINS